MERTNDRCQANSSGRQLEENGDGQSNNQNMGHTENGDPNNNNNTSSLTQQPPSTTQDVHTRERLFDFIALLQGRRMDDQRATLKPS